MKFKRLMMVTILLLAVLTIGAASAADDAISDDLAVSDEGDVIDVSQDDELGDMNADEVNIEVDDIDRTEDDYGNYNFTEITVSEKSGNYVICTGEGDNTVEVYRQDLSSSDKYYVGEFNEYHFGVSLNDVNNYIASNIDSEKNFYDIFDASDKCFRFVLEYGGEDFVVKSYDVDVSDDSITFTEKTDVDEFYISVNENEMDIENLENNQDFASIILPDETTGTFIISRCDEGEDVDIFTSDIPEAFEEGGNWYIGEDGNIHGDFYLNEEFLNQISDMDYLKFWFRNADGDEMESLTKFADVSKTDTTLQFTVKDEEEGDEDAEDGVIIDVSEDGFDLENDEDLARPFAYVSISDELSGTITISAYDDESMEDIVFFEKGLSSITDKEEDVDHDGFTVYYISLKDINDLDKFVEWGYFTIDFSDEEGEIDSSSYYILVDEENDKIIRFVEDNGDEEPSGEGEVLEGVEFRNANAQTNDVVVVIPMADFPQDIANEFSVIVITDDDEIHTGVRLDELQHDDSSYYIRVNDLGIEELEIGEGIEVELIVQFYDENGDPIYYAQTFEDGGIYIYNSPFIYDEASLFNYDDDVITFQEIPDGVDEFNVTIQKEGGDAIVKTFKFSQLENLDEEDGLWYALTFKKDLGITEIGYYEITVKFSEELKYTGNLNVNREMDIRIHNYEDDDPESELREFTSVDEIVVVLRISEAIKGSVNLTIDDNDPIVFDFDDLKYDPGHPPSNGRQILLNDLNIQKSGTYTINMTIYDENGGLIDEKEFNILVTVGENTVEFNDAYYTAEIFDTIKFTISTPLSSGQYYNIYFNDELAGKYSTDGIVITNDKFYDLIWGDGEGDDVKFLKIGDYDVNITFFDGENESSTLFAGKFSIKSLNMTADKDNYLEDENITISFDAQDPGEYYPVVYVQKTLGWGYMGPFFDEDWEKVFEGEEVAELIKDGKFTVNIGKLPLGTNYICVEYYLYESRDDYLEDDDAVFAFHDLIPIKVISPVDPALTISVSNITEGASAVITITTNETFNGNVLVKIETANYTVSVVNGTGSAQVTGLAVGTHNATAIFEATDAFLASEKNTIFTVKAKVATAITASALTTTYATSKNIIVTLKDSNGNALTGKDVIIVLNGATKIVKTNDKGQATLAIGTALAPKAYLVTLSFAGDANYVKSTGTVKVTVNKAKPVLTAKKKTFKVKKAKKYTVALKTDKKKALKKVKVTLTGKFKGKKIKITVKTNAKGKATFNLKKLTKKGKFKATIKFAGNKYYNAVTKKVKLTVK